MNFTGLMDMFDGGGAGRSGQRFEGGPFSGLLNQIGARPAGFQERMGEVRPQARPQMPTQQPAMQPMQQPAPQPQPMQYGPQSRPNNAPQQPAPVAAQLPGGLTYEAFVAGLGPAAQGATRDQLMQAYAQHMQQYQR